MKILVSLFLLTYLLPNSEAASRVNWHLNGSVSVQLSNKSVAHRKILVKKVDKNYLMKVEKLSITLSQAEIDLIKEECKRHATAFKEHKKVTLRIKRIQKQLWLSALYYPNANISTVTLRISSKGNSVAVVFQGKNIRKLAKKIQRIK